jgi:uncharacterized protein
MSFSRKSSDFVTNRDMECSYRSFRAVFTVIVILSYLPVRAIDIPSRPQSAVADYAGVLSPEVNKSLASLSDALWQETGVAVVLVTVTGLEGGDIDNTAGEIYNKWGIGSKAKNEGTLVLFSLKDRRIRIETGYGTEEYVPDVVASRIIRQAADQYLSKGNWNGGLSFIMDALMRKVAERYGIPAQRIEQRSGAQFDSMPAFSAGISKGKLLLIALLLLFFLGTSPGRTLLFFMLMNAASRGSSSRSMSGGGWGGRIGGGGFGGFGGGHSGGGGASGRF